MRKPRLLGCNLHTAYEQNTPLGCAVRCIFRMKAKGDGNMATCLMQSSLLTRT